MESTFDITLKNREVLYRILTATPKEQLLAIPKGYRNSIWWNMAHVVVTQQLLVYKNSGLSMHVSTELVDKFRKGTVPDGLSRDEEMEEVKANLFRSVDRMREDYQGGLFKTYNGFTTSLGVAIENVEDAIAFNLFHEGLHLGTILSLRKMLKAPS